MGQITNETIAMIRRDVDAGQFPSLTLWEYTQLAWLAERQIAEAKPAQPTALTQAERRELIDRAGDITDGLNQDDFADEIINQVLAAISAKKGQP